MPITIVERSMSLLSPIVDATWHWGRPSWTSFSPFYYSPLDTFSYWTPPYFFYPSPFVGRYFYGSYFYPFFFDPWYLPPIPPPVWPWPGTQTASGGAAQPATTQAAQAVPVTQPAAAPTARTTPSTVTESAEQEEEKVDPLKKAQQEYEQSQRVLLEEATRKNQEQLSQIRGNGGRGGSRKASNSAEIRVDKYSTLPSKETIYKIDGKNSYILIDQKGDIYKAQFKSEKFVKGKKMEGYRLDPTGQKLVKG